MTPSSLRLTAGKAPRNPGVYFFWGAPRRTRGKRPLLYIGKAANLRDRLRSHFVKSAAPSISLWTSLSPAKRALLYATRRLTWETTENDIAALIREAELIKKHHPKYNVLFRDDKQYFYVGFTKENFPRVFLTHQPKLANSEWQIANSKSEKKLYAIRHKPSATYIGPFTEGKSIRRTLRLLRRIFPYATHAGFPKRCLEHELGMCPIPPTTSNLKPTTEFRHSYQRNIRAMKEILSGKRRRLLGQIEQEMQKAARKNDFETAAKRRDELYGLERVFSHRTVLEKGAEHALAANDIPTPIRRLLHDRGSTSIMRIEGYDISSLAQGKYATGAMVAFRCARNNTNRKTNQREYVCAPDRDAYRQFKIKTVHGANDVAMITEVLKRRFAHREWPLPDLMLIDGGLTQLHTALKTVQRHEMRLNGRPLVLALAKRNEELYIPGRAVPLRLPKNDPFLLLLMHIRDEAHRFARRYHHRLRDLTR